MIRVARVPLEKIEPLRRQRAAPLFIPVMDDFTERLIQQGQAWGFFEGETLLGYYVRSGDAVPEVAESIVEFYFDRAHWRMGREALRNVIEHQKPRGLWFRSDDVFAMSLVLDEGFLFQKVGLALIRQKGLRSEAPHSSLIVAPLSEETFEAAFDILLGEDPKDGGCREEDRERIHREIGKGTCFVLLDQRAVVGVGWGAFLPEGFVDLGFVIHPEYRSKGYGSYLASEVSLDFQRRGHTVIAGTNIENQASRRALEKAGFTVFAFYLFCEFPWELHQAIYGQRTPPPGSLPIVS